MKLSTCYESVSNTPCMRKSLTYASLFKIVMQKWGNIRYEDSLLIHYFKLTFLVCPCMRISFLDCKVSKIFSFYTLKSETVIWNAVLCSEDSGAQYRSVQWTRLGLCHSRNNSWQQKNCISSFRNCLYFVITK